MLALATVMAILTRPGVCGEVERTRERECAFPGGACVELRIDEQIAALGSAVAHEEVERYSRIAGRTRLIDSMDATSEVIGGVQTFSAIRRNGRIVLNASDISGTWSFGEMTAVLITSRDGIEQAGLETRKSVHSGADFPLVSFFHFAPYSGRWYVTVDSKVYWLDLSGEVEVLPSTGQVVYVRWTSGMLPLETSIERIIWTVRFKSTEIGGQRAVLPDSAEYVVQHRRNRTEWNRTRFDRWSRYGSQASIEFRE
jgi:hypothetical protein